VSGSLRYPVWRTSTRSTGLGTSMTLPNPSRWSSISLMTSSIPRIPTSYLRCQKASPNKSRTAILTLCDPPPLYVETTQKRAEVAHLAKTIKNSCLQTICLFSIHLLEWHMYLWPRLHFVYLNSGVFAAMAVCHFCRCLFNVQTSQIYMPYILQSYHKFLSIWPNPPRHHWRTKAIAESGSIVNWHHPVDKSKTLPLHCRLVYPNRQCCQRDVTGESFTRLSYNIYIYFLYYLYIYIASYRAEIEFVPRKLDSVSV